MAGLRLALAQVNPTVGALEENRSLLEAHLKRARELGARLVLFPELVLTGYPPEDLLRADAFLEATRRELLSLLPATRGLLAVVGLPIREGRDTYNAAALLLDGRWVDTYAKGTLPNYGVFDEKRYFRPGLRCPVHQWGDLTFGINICEDLWASQGVPAIQTREGARLLLNLSSSPYHADKGREREALLRRRARRHAAAIAYVNLVGGQDELVFDGESLVVDASGRVRARAPQFESMLLVVDLREEWLRPIPAADSASPFEAPQTPLADPSFPRDLDPAFTEPHAEPIDEIESQFFAEQIDLEPPPSALSGGGISLGSEQETARPAIPPASAGVEERLEGEPEVYAALRLGLRDYVIKNRFRSVVIGLSGGIDSALTAVLAVDALGPERVHGVSMPSRYSSAATRQGAVELAGNLGIGFREIPIEDTYKALLTTLTPVFQESRPDVTEENIQARIRGTILVALSNRFGHLVLTTGNKSELAVGYCTLYGDMVGGFAVLKDVPKTMVYRLARYRNSLGTVIPEDTLTRPPSAELREDQRDTDTLPPYEVLDPIVRARTEFEEPPDSLVRKGFDPAWVESVYRWIDANEYKRRQAPPGIKITPRAFGRDRRYPITNRFRWHP